MGIGQRLPPTPVVLSISYLHPSMIFQKAFTKVELNLLTEGRANFISLVFNTTKIDMS